jgi:hypothetical protein
MTTAEIEQKIQAARKRGDGREVGRLRAELPFEERKRIFGEWSTAVNRGYVLPTPQLSSTYNPLTGDSDQQVTTVTTSPSQAWPAVAIDPYVLRAITNIGYDGHESGGFLVLSTSEIEIVDFFEARNEDTATWRSVELSFERAQSVLANLPLDRTLGGDWHQHLSGGGVYASTADLKGAAGLARSFGRPHWISLIVSDPDPEDRYALHAEVGAYIVRPDGTYSSTTLTEKRSF